MHRFKYPIYFLLSFLIPSLTYGGEILLQSTTSTNNSGFYRYILDVNKMILKERYIIEREGFFSNIISLFDGRKYYKKEITLKCRLFKSWLDIENYFAQQQ